MLKDITLGQYFPGDTIVHRLDPRTKLILVVLYIAALFQAAGWISYLTVTAVTALCMALSHIRPKNIFKGLKPMLFIIVFTALLNLFYTSGREIIPGWHMTWEGLGKSVQMILRIVLLITGTFLLTYTTSPIALTDGLEQGLHFLTYLKVPVHEFALMMAIALKKCGIIDAKAYYYYLDQAIAQGIIRKEVQDETGRTWIVLVDNQLPF